MPQKKRLAGNMGFLYYAPLRIWVSETAFISQNTAWKIYAADFIPLYAAWHGSTVYLENDLDNSLIMVIYIYCYSALFWEENTPLSN